MLAASLFLFGLTLSLKDNPLVPIGPGFYPRIVLVATAALALALLVTDLLRKRFGHALPAIVVTGSSMTGHDKEALEHDFHLLIKPVLPNKLRAMIAFKLGRR